MLPAPMIATVLSEIVILIHLSRGLWLGGQGAAQVAGGLRVGFARVAEHVVLGVWSSSSPAHTTQLRGDPSARRVERWT